MTTQERIGIARLRPPEAGKSMIDETGEKPVRPPRARTPEELVVHFSVPVWRFVSSQIARREEAEDVVMEVFGAAFAAFDKLERADDQRLWLLAVARNKVANSLRRQYRRAEHSFQEAAETAEPLGVTELQLATRSALEGIPPEQRQALILKYVNGLGTEEVGKVIRRSIQATNSLLQRGRESLRRALGPALLGSFKDAS